jgi:hypothetical protein
LRAYTHEKEQEETNGGSRDNVSTNICAHTHSRAHTVKVKHLVIIAVIHKHGAVNAAGESVEERDAVRAAQLVETHQHRQVGRLRGGRERGREGRGKRMSEWGRENRE